MLKDHVSIELSDKQLFLLIEAAESKMRWFADEVGRLGENFKGEVDGWDGNDIGLLTITVREFQEIQESRRREAAARLPRAIE
jgi:hypothetical protein